MKDVTLRTYMAPLLFVCILLSSIVHAGKRGPGKYSGIVIFDRWDGCTLYSSVYVMYVSESEKEKLRKHVAQAVQVDAKQVEQPMNPGDALIKNLAYLGQAPAGPNWIALDSLVLSTKSALTEGERPRLTIALKNTGNKDVEVFSSELAPTLLTKRKDGDPTPRAPSDGPSFALITRQAFSSGDEPRTSGRGWKIDAGLPRQFILKPNDTRSVSITFDLPEGEYDFVAGYGGGVHQGKGIASNLVAFDVSATGKAKFVKVKGR
jgi:hypothetical protein